MLESGELLPTQLVYDLPMRIGGFAPQNFSRGFEGVVTAHAALSRSLNVPAVSMLYSYGYDRFYSLLKQLGMTTLFRSAADYGLTLIIGGAEGSLWDITGIYSNMARCLTGWFSDSSTGEYSPEPLSYRTRIHPRPPVNSHSASAMPLSAGSIWLTFSAMEEVVRPEEESMWRQFSSSRRVAWKTGTSFGFRDAWAVGITPEYTVGVWVGNADGVGRPNLTGLSAAAPVLFEIFDLFDKTTWFSCPEADLMPVEICARSGFRAGMHCREKKRQDAPPAACRTKTCPYCKLYHFDRTGSFRVHSGCEKVADMVHTPWFVLPPAAEWFYRKKHYEYRPLPPWREDCRESAPEESHRSLSIIYPRVGSSIYIPFELDGKKGKTVFKAAHRRSDALIYWHLDNEYLGLTRTLHQMSAAPEPGVHRLTIVDDQGESVSRRFEILAEDHP
jgi:penicillin-binding protein 1C